MPIVPDYTMNKRLTVLALVIIGAYIYLLPRGKKKNKI